MQAIQLPGDPRWYLKFDGEIYGPFPSAQEAIAFDDREMADEETESYRVTKYAKDRFWAADCQRKHFSDTP